MSWEEHDLLGDMEDEINQDYLYDDDEDEQILEEEEIVYDDDNDDYTDELLDEIDDFLSVEDIDFSSLDGKNLKKDFKQINRAVQGRKVASRKSIQGRQINKLQAQQRKTEFTKKRREQVTRKPTEAKQIRVARKPTESKQIRVARKPTERKQIRVAPKPMPKQIVKQVASKKCVIAKPTKVFSKKPIVKSKIEVQKPTRKFNVPIKKSAVIQSRFGKKTTERILVPQDRKVIVEGVDRFILSNTKESESLKNIGYYNGEKLKELVLIINNNTPQDFEFELFNPSMPLDYLFSSSQNLNNRISVAGDDKVQYSDLLFNILANPTLLPNAKFSVENATNPLQARNQFNIPMIFKNKNIAGHEKINPIQNDLNFDIDQRQKQIVYWDIMQSLGRAYIPDGMDVISYKVLAGNTVVFGFYYKQVSLKRFFFKEARDKKIL